MSRRALLALACLALAGLLTVGTWRLSKSPTIQILGDIVPRVETDQKVVALTFDDGPTARWSGEVLALLEEEGVRATFFAIGQALERNPDLCREIVAAGHELGNHSYSHRPLILVSYATVRHEIEQTDALIRACGQQGEIYFRPPNGKKLLLLPYYLWRTGRTTVTWDVAPEWGPDGAADAGQIIDRVLADTRPGSIILLHVMYESRAEARQALPAVIRGLKERGYRFVTVSELLSRTAPLD